MVCPSADSTSRSRIAWSSLSCRGSDTCGSISGQINERTPMATTTPDSWTTPDLSSAADITQLTALMQQVEATLNNRQTLTYTPTWTSAGAQQPTNPSERFGLYKIGFDGW